MSGLQNTIRKLISIILTFMRAVSSFFPPASISFWTTRKQVFFFFFFASRLTWSCYLHQSHSQPYLQWFHTIHPSRLTFTGCKTTLQHCLKMPLDVSWTSGFFPWHSQQAAVGQDLYQSHAKCHGGGYDLWSVGKQDKSIIQPSRFITLCLPEEAQPATLSRLPCPSLPTTNRAGSWPIPCPPSHTHPLSP